MPKTTQPQKPASSNSHSQTPPNSLNQGSLQVGPQLLQRAIANPNAGSLTPPVIQRLQQQYGNRFVMRLVQRMDTSAPAKTLPIQRRFKYTGKAHASVPGIPPKDAWQDVIGNLYELTNAQPGPGGIVLTFNDINAALPPQFFTAPNEIKGKKYVGFTPDGIQYEGANLFGPHDNLQDLTQIAELMDPASPFAPNAKSVFTAIPQANFIPEFHNTTFVGRVSLVPMNSVQGNELFKSTEIWVDDVKISDDRPPTQFGKDGQKSHTVAWTLLRVALQKLQGQPLDQFFTILNGMVEDMTPSNSVDAERAFTTLKARLNTGIAQTKDTNKATAIFFWQRLASDVLGQYVHLYQISRAATYSDGQAIGHGEPGHMSMLHRAESVLKMGRGLPPTELQYYKAAAVGLMDIKNRLSDKTIAQVFHHWLNLLHLAFPMLMRNHHHDIVAALQLDGTQQLALTTALGKDPTLPMDAILNKSTTSSIESPLPMAETAITRANQSTFTANVFVVPQKSVARTNMGIEGKSNGMVSDTNTLSLGHYKAPDLKIEQVEVADDRPNTRYGILQRSHTVAWTFIRRFLISFGGKSASTLLDFIRGELPILQQDIPAQGRRIPYDAPAEAARLHLNLTQITANTDGFPIHQWQTRLSEIVESYITLYQLSKSATYVKEERPAPHGEGSAIQTLDRYESEVAAIGDPADRLTHITPSLNAVAKSAKRLVDAVVGTPTLAPKQWKTAIEHWLRLLRGKYPILMGIPSVETNIKDAVAVAEPQDEVLAGYKPKRPKREFNTQDKIIINIYDKAETAMRSAVNQFNLDIQKSLQRELSELNAPKDESWSNLVYATQLTNPQLRVYQKPIQDYQSRTDKRKTERQLPTHSDMTKLQKDASNFTAHLKDNKEKIVSDLFTSIEKRSKGHKIDPTVKTFVADNSESIKQKLGLAFDDAIDGSVVNELNQAHSWFNIILDIDIGDGVNYTSVMNSIG